MSEIAKWGNICKYRNLSIADILKIISMVAIASTIGL